MSDRTPDEIEREIEVERAALTGSLDALQHELSPEVIVDKVSAFLREHGGAAAGPAFRQARDNPMAIAMTGIGLAWLAAGPIQRRDRPLRLPPPSASASPDRPRTPRASPGYDHRRYDQVEGFRESGDPMAGFDDRLARASGDATDPTLKDRFDDAVTAAKEHLMSMKSRFSDATGDPKTTARDLRAYLSEGTEQMTESTRERVVAARRAAWDAERRIEARARDYAESGREFYSAQPLIGGLVAFGLGAAIGAALPRTRQEDHYLGSYRDRAMEEAESFYHAEAAKLRESAERIAEDAKKIATETLEDVKNDAKGQKAG